MNGLLLGRAAVVRDDWQHQLRVGDGFVAPHGWIPDHTGASAMQGSPSDDLADSDSPIVRAQRRQGRALVLSSGAANKRACDGLTAASCVIKI